MSIWNKRFASVEDVPLVSFPVVPYDHPDKHIIRTAYDQFGGGIAFTFSVRYKEEVKT